MQGWRIVKQTWHCSAQHNYRCSAPGKSKRRTTLRQCVHEHEILLPWISSDVYAGILIPDSRECWPRCTASRCYKVINFIHQREVIDLNRFRSNPTGKIFISSAEWINIAQCIDKHEANQKELNSQDFEFDSLINIKLNRWMNEHVFVEAGIPVVISSSWAALLPMCFESVVLYTTSFLRTWTFGGLNDFRRIVT